MKIIYLSLLIASVAVGLAAPVQAEVVSAATDRAGSSVGSMELLVLFSVGLFFYFFPSIIGRSKRNSGAIFVLNLFTGWSFIGWVIALVWASMAESQAVEVPKLPKTQEPVANPQTPCANPQAPRPWIKRLIAGEFE